MQIKEKNNEIAKMNAQLQYAEQEAKYYKDYLIRLNGIKQEERPDDSKYLDGIYEGTAKGFGGNITVSVEIKEGSIHAINVMKASEEDGACLEMAKDIIDQIIKADSTEVDTISGATFSSAGIKDAVAKALESAIK